MGIIGSVASLFPSNTVVGKLGRGEKVTGTDLKKAVQDVKNTLNTGVVKIGDPSKGKSVNVAAVIKSAANGGLSSLNNAALAAQTAVNNKAASDSLKLGSVGAPQILTTASSSMESDTSVKADLPIIPIVVGYILYQYLKKNKYV